MTTPQISEFSYGFALTNEIVAWAPLRLAPIFPSWLLNCSIRDELRKMILIEDRVGGTSGAWAYDFYMSIARAEIDWVERQTVALTLPRWIEDPFEAGVLDKSSKDLARRRDSVGLGIAAPLCWLIEELRPQLMHRSDGHAG